MLWIPGLEMVKSAPKPVSLSFPPMSSSKNLIIHDAFVQYRNLATLASLQLQRWTGCSKAIENNGEATKAPSVWQRSSSREGPCWLNLQQLFDKLVTRDSAARCSGEKLFCDVVLRMFRFFMALPPLNSNSTFFVLCLYHLTWERAKGLGLEFLESRLVAVDCPLLIR